MGRRAAVFIHAEDVSDVKGGKSNDEKAPAPSKKKAVSPKKSQEVRSSSTTPVDTQHAEAMKRRRASLSYQARRPSTLPEMSTAPPPRRASVRRGSTLPPYTSYGTPARRPSMKPNPPPPAKPAEPAKPALTKQQIAAFQEVFDLFDSNGGGTIDAEELQQALASVDIFLTEEEINDVLLDIDEDGSGEIDFEEFLSMMTNTEKFLEMFANKHENDPGRTECSGGTEGREMILFDALTKFMRSSALKQMEEIVGFYKTQYKRVQAPHVVMHYAAGARLIGLTEKQLVQHMKLLQQSNRENNYQSPYAQPLRFILMGPPRKRQIKKKVPPPTIPSDEPRCRGKIKIKIRMANKHDTNSSQEQKPAGEGDNGKTKKKLDRLTEKHSYISVYKPRLGWVESKVKHIEHRLPTTNRLVYANDLPTIRKSIAVATREYRHDVAESKRKDNMKYWKSQHPEQIPSKKLQNNFRKVFNAYIPLDLKPQVVLKR